MIPTWRPKGRHSAIALLLAGGLAGCGDDGFAPPPPTFAVQGQVLLKDGKPLADGRVVFLPKEDITLPGASAPLGPDGRFALSTREDGDGAAAGTYKVRIEPGPAAAKRTARPKYPLKYIDEDSSGLVVTVKAEPNRLDPIRLK